MPLRNPGSLLNGGPLKNMAIEYESIPPGVEASDLHIGEKATVEFKDRRILAPIRPGV